MIKMIIRVRRISDGQYVTPEEALKDEALKDIPESGFRLWEPEGFALSDEDGLMVYDGCGNYVWIPRDNYDVEIVL